MRKLSPKLLTGIIIALFFGVALYLRVCLPYDQVFSGDWIKFTSVDAYRHMRLIDSLVHNFPHLIPFDPYVIYLGTVKGVGMIHFFDWFLAGIIWVIGLGSPTQHTVDVVSVYFPAILGALCVVPVYFIGKELFHRWAGVIAAGLIALLPGEFLGRSILGFTDHHVAETLFSTTTILFLILAIKAARQRHLTFGHFKHRDWATLNKPVIYSLLTGIFLGIYLLSWGGALLFVFIISLYFIIQSIIDHLRRQSTEYLCAVGTILFFIALLIFLPAYQQNRIYPTSMVIALFIPLVLTAISRLLTTKKIKPAYYPLSMVGVGLVGMGALYLISLLTTTPTRTPLFSSMLEQFRIFAPRGAYLTVLEMQPILFPGGEFSFRVVWANFTTSIFLSLIALGFLIYLVVKHKDAEKTLLIVWSLVILAATLGQRRFAYYFAVNIALLTGYLSWRVLLLAGLGKPAVVPAEIPVKGERGKIKLKKKGSSPTADYLKIALAVIAIFFLVFFPNIRPAITTASQARFAPNDAWCHSLAWLKENTPDPFGDPEYYYQLYQMPPGESYRSYEYPESAYGVTAWWDYGFWITRIGHRLPNSNPGQAGVTDVAGLFLSQDEDSADEIIQELDSSYIIIDFTTVTQKFWAIATWAGKEETVFHEPYYLPQKEDFVMLFHPEYYQSLAVRLYNFDGKAVTPEKTYVISFKEKESREGKTYKQITSSKSFTSYEEAVAYLSQQGSDNYRIIGINSFQSPVPLAAVKHYQLVYGSDIRVKDVGVDNLSAVKIFEYVE